MNRTSPDDTRARILGILDESARCAVELKESLVVERDALEQGDTRLLDAAAASKTGLIDQLARLNQARGEISMQAGFGSDTHAMGALTEWCDDDRQVGNCWQHFVDIAGECDVINKTNGAIIRLRRQQVLDGLSLLRGNPGDTGTYTPTGSASSAVASRELTEA